MIDLKQEKSITYFIVVCFVASAVIATGAFLIFPPDFSKEFPVYSPNLVMLQEFGGSLGLAGLTVMGIKLADERKVMPAAGFTMLAISTGVLMVSFFEITTVVSHESYMQFYYVSASGYFLYLPAMYLISSYEDFKKWIRYIGLITTIPLMSASFIFLFGSRNFKVLEAVSDIGYLMLFITQLCWAYNIHYNYRKKLLPVV